MGESWRSLRGARTRRARLLSNGDYQVVVSAAGGGGSLWRGEALTRWSADWTADAEGFFVYLRDLDSGAVWSVGERPCAAAARAYRAAAAPGRVRLAATRGRLEGAIEIFVAADSAAEVRVLTLRNRGARARRIEVTTCLELALCSPAAFAAHPAFRKLFVQTEIAGGEVMVAGRRPRGADEAPLFAAHALWGDGAIEWESDRARFVGRGRDLRNPAALTAAAPLSGTVGNVLDPIFALRRSLRLEAGATAQLVAVLAAGDERESAIAAARRLAHGEAVGAVAAAAAARELALAALGGLAPVEVETLAERCAALAYGEATVRYFPLRSRRAFRRVRGDDFPPPAERPAETLLFANGHGGFAADGREYVLRLGGDRLPPPMPWANVIANEDFGCLLSESGAGCTWSRNSRENRLTPWTNDPISDPHEEALYVRDEEAGVYWSPLPGPCPAPGAYEARHGFGYSVWRHGGAELDQETCVFVAAEAPLRLMRLRLCNRSARERLLSVFAFQRLVLGVSPAESAPHVGTEIDPVNGVLLARNPSRGVFSDAVVFAAAHATPAAESTSWSADRVSFLGRDGDAARPRAVCGESALDGRCGGGLDPCAALQMRLRISPGGTVECVFLLGEVADAAAARQLRAAFAKGDAVAAELERVRVRWERRLTAVRVETPLPALDVMMNGWLLYQVLSCRLWGRSAFYQSGGAFGFRDQLQDAAALLHSDPARLRAQILLHAARQFRAGDVLHWWHPPGARGIRTRFSDDLLWLPFLTDSYVRGSGDRAILDEPIAFVSGPALAADEDERFFAAQATEENADLYTHCCLAIDRSLRVGAHGLPLMGSGDWNDGMNRVGREGRGESVWLAFFLCAILESFSRWCDERGDAARAARYRQHRAALIGALEENAWDGDWYRRAYYDDGTPLGSAANDECRIDALAQAWAVISNAVPRQRAARAMDAVDRHLVDTEAGLIRLLAPPFDRTAHDPGYIKGYVPGIRENGGQYTHAALWVVRACAELDRRDRAAALLEMLLPIRHADSSHKVAVYQVEPYVVAADVYGVAPHLGRGGWTWYTGSAAWMYRVALESVLGVSVEDGARLCVRPRIPDHWPGYRLTYRPNDGATRYEIEVVNPNRNAASVVAAEVDGAAVPPSDGAARIDLSSDGSAHRARIVLGGR